MALPPQAKGKAPPTEAPSLDKFSVIGGRISRPQRVVVYGPGGIGKSTLAALAPAPVFLDIEGGSNEIDVQRVEGLESLQDVRTCLQSGMLNDFSTVVLDSATKAEELAVAHTLETVKHEKGNAVTSIEGYGFGKGYQHVYDTFLLLLADLDKQIRAGRNVVLVAHDCISEAPNPAGDNFIRSEPHLQAPKSGKASIRNRVCQWADHVLFIGYDVNVRDGKGQGTGTRTIWSAERPDHIAKSRLAISPIPFTAADDAAIWSYIFGGAK